MPLTALALCARALLRIGAQPIASLDEGTAEAEVAANLYPAIRDALVTAHPWSFATALVPLARLSAVPAADFRHAYALPPGFLRALSAGGGGPGSGSGGGSGRGIAYRIHESRLLTDAEAVTLTCIFRPDEAAFPAFFASALVARLAAEFCLPLTESASRAEMLFRLAETELRQARQIDSQQATPRAIEGFPLVDVR